MDIKLIFFDLDFTLLTSLKTITNRTIEALDYARSKGIKLAFATSRGNKAITEYSQLIRPDIIISNGGASIYYEQLIHKECFTIEETKKILLKIKEIFGSNIEITVDTLEDLYWNRLLDKSTPYRAFSIYDDFHNFNKEAMKICVHSQDKALMNQLIKGNDNIASIPFSDIPWYKLSPIKATKEEAVKYVMKDLNLNRNNVCAFGDDYSDLNMLATVGYGISMGNAVEDVRNKAYEVTDTCDKDGVALWIEKNL